MSPLPLRTLQDNGRAGNAPFEESGPRPFTLASPWHRKQLAWRIGRTSLAKSED
jgi:hypothetical protein